MTLPFAGVIVVWSGTKPCLETYRIPAGGLVFGRVHADASDERISRHHLELTTEDNRIIVEDRNSRNGSYVNGEAVSARSVRPTLPAIVRTGRTVSVLVPDVRPYEHVPISRRGGLVVAGSLDPACRAMDRAAIEEENVLVAGTISIGYVLAQGYAAALGGTSVVIDTMPEDISIARALDRAGSVRSVTLVIGRPVPDEDILAIGHWLETDVRFVTLMRSDILVRGMPGAIVGRLAARFIEIPRCRFDELPTTLHELFHARLPAAQLHANAVEHALIRARDTDEDILLERFTVALAAFQGDTFRSADLAPHLVDPIPSNWARVIPPQRR